MDQFYPYVILKFMTQYRLYRTPIFPSYLFNYGKLETTKYAGLTSYLTNQHLTAILTIVIRQ